jgi:uncharacterized membrane protein YfcA
MDGESVTVSTWAMLQFLALGFGVGAYGTLIGAGGGFVLAPVLLLLFPSTSASTITAMSLTVVFFNAYAGTWAYARTGRIDYPAGIRFALAGIPGAVLGTWVVHLIPRKPFDFAFGVTLLAVGVFLIVHPMRRGNSPSGSTDADPRAARRRSRLGSIGSAYLGLISTLLGIGGGILHVPFLVRVIGYAPHIATATSHFVLAIVAFTASLAHLLRGELEGVMMPTAFLALGVMMGAPVGAVFSTVVRGPLLLRLLAVALCAVALRLLW